MSVTHDHEHERKAHVVSRLQQDQQPHKEGLALRHRVTLDSEAHQFVLARTPTVHLCPTGKAVGGPQPAPRDDHRQTTTRHGDALCKTLEMKDYVHSEKFMDVSDMQVSDRDGCKSRSTTIKANSKIVKERI